MTVRDEPAPMTGICESCGIRRGALDGSKEYFCKVCAPRNALYTAAYDSLAFLFMQAIKAWAVTWGPTHSEVLVEEFARHAGPETAQAFLEQQKGNL